METIKQAFRHIPRGQWMMIVPSYAESACIGVEFINLSRKGTATINYCGGTQRIGHLETTLFDSLRTSDLGSIVSAIETM